MVSTNFGVIHFSSFLLAVRFTCAYSFSNGYPFLQSLHISKKAKYLSQIKRTSIQPRTTHIFLSTTDEKDGKPWWRDEGDAIIRAAAIEAGADENKLKVDWGPGYITVIVGGEACLSTSSGDDDDEENVEEENEEEATPPVEDMPKGPDITAIARAINKALDGEEGSVGMTVAVNHSIDVTTPGAPDELYGIMFESYKGFDVIVEAYDKKKDKNVVINGRLVERAEDITIINIKGRMKKLKNELISSIRLPKSKREKGV